MRTTEEVAEIYFTSWQAGDTDTLRSILADDVSFSGPLAQIDNAESAATLDSLTTDILSRHGIALRTRSTL